MGFFKTLQAIKTWFTGFIPKKSTKRRIEECETISNKRARMDDNSLVEVVEISDESLSEAELEITKPGPSTTMPHRASLPVRFVGSENHQRQTKSPVKTLHPATGGMVRSASASLILENKRLDTSTVKGLHNSCSNMGGSFSALNISSFPPKVDDKEKILAKIIKHYILPAPEKNNLSDANTKSPQSLRKEYVLNQSTSSQLSSKENLEYPELSHNKNKVLKEELFYERVMRRFREAQEAVAKSLPVVKQKSPEEIFREKLEVLHNEVRKIKPLKKKEIFPGYSQGKCDFIRSEMSKSPMEKIFRNIRIKDLHTLYQSRGWLNDEVINHYFAMLIARDPESLYKFDTFFYEKISSCGYQAVRRWTKKKDIFACKKIMIPIHLGNHWCMVCVNLVEKTVKYYDSLKGKNPQCLNIIFNYLKEEYKNKKNEDFDCSGWQLMDADDCPLQSNGYDCGVFVCVNAEYLARDAVLDFVQGDIPMLRKKLCYEILKNQLCY